MKKAVVFSGQGSHYAGMLRQHHLTGLQQRRLESLVDYLGNDVEQYLFNPNFKGEKSTLLVQPALFYVNHLMYEGWRLLNKGDIILAGHSLGEINALVASGVCSFDLGLEMVLKRAELMQACSAQLNANYETFVFRSSDMTDIIEFVSGQKGAYVSNYNSPSQIMLSIDTTIKAELFEAVKSKFDLDVIPLDLPYPFHTYFFQSAASNFQAYLATLDFNTFRFPVVSNLTAQNYNDESEICSTLAAQISHSVHWDKILKQFEEVGITQVIEISPKPTWCNVINKEYSQLQCETVSCVGSSYSENINTIYAKKVAAFIATTPNVIQTNEAKHEMIRANEQLNANNLSQQDLLAILQNCARVKGLSFDEVKHQLIEEGTPETQVEFVILPHAGGLSSFYQKAFSRLEKLLPVNICFIDYPNRPMSELTGEPESIQDLAEIVAHYLERKNKKNIILFGHSFGGTVALEVASMYQDNFVQVIVSGSAPPFSVRKIGESMSLIPEQDLLKRLHALGGLDDFHLTNMAMQSYFYRFFKADVELMASYEPSDFSALKTPVNVIMGNEDPLYSKQYIDDFESEVSQVKRFKCVAGDHFYFNKTHMWQDAFFDLILN